MATLNARVRDALLAAGLPATMELSMPSYTDKSTWKVQPATLQAAAQPIIDAYDLGVDAARTRDEAIDALLDSPLAGALLDLLAESGAPDTSQQIQPSPKGQTIQRPASPRDALRDRLKGHLQRRLSPPNATT